MLHNSPKSSDAQENRHEDTLNRNNVLSNDISYTQYENSNEDVTRLKSKLGHSNNSDHHSDPLMNEEKKKGFHNTCKLTARSKKLTAARERYSLQIEAL